MFFLAYSIAMPFVNMLIAALVVQYTVKCTFGIARSLDIEPILIIDPLFFSNIFIKTDFVILKVPYRLVLIKAAQSESGISWKCMGSLIRPALFTSMSIFL